MGLFYIRDSRIANIGHLVENGQLTAARYYLFAAVNHRTATISTIAVLTFFVCVLVAAIVHEPLPRTHDEFSYRLMGETLAEGHLSNPAPPVPEFFDTFHIIQHRVYASKYFPPQ
jgi:hypothetical protein